MLLFGRLDWAASAGRFFVRGIPTPVQSVTITVGSFGFSFKNLNEEKQMKTFASTHSCTQKIVKEHTPIYDLQAYLLRQRKIKSQKRFKNFKTALTCLMCFSLFLFYLK